MATRSWKSEQRLFNKPSSLFLVVRPRAPSSVLVPGSKARRPSSVLVGLFFSHPLVRSQSGTKTISPEKVTGSLLTG